MTTTLNAHNLQRIIDQVRNHQGDYGPVSGINFDADTTHLHAVATDRYTFAVGRADAPTEKPWSAILHHDNVTTLRRWLKNIQPTTNVTISTDTDAKTITVSEGRTSLTFPAVDSEFPKWRKFFAGVLAKEPQSPVTGLDAEYMARWKTGDRQLRTWATGDKQPIVLAGRDFLGLQMPTLPNEKTFTPQAVANEWKNALGDAQSDDAAVEMATPGQPPKQTRDFTEWLLRVVATSTSDIMDADSVRTPAFHRSIDASCAAMAAYRLMVALKTADPRYAEKVLAELHEELEGGEFSEWAWEYAQDAGHNPDEWVKQHQEWRSKLLAQAAAAENDD